MATLSFNVGIDNKENYLTNEDIWLENNNQDVFKCEGAPQRLWTSKCVMLHNNKRLAMVEGICHYVISNLVIETTRVLEDTHIVD